MFICTRCPADFRTSLGCLDGACVLCLPYAFCKVRTDRIRAQRLWKGAIMSFKVMAVCAGRHGGNGEALAKEALCAVREAGGEV